MLSELDQVRWDQFPQPTWNAPEALPSALRALAKTTKSDDFTAYNRLLYAMGNNHAGTYFPVALAAIPFVVQILQQAPLSARLRALDVLFDLVGSFGPEPGFEHVVTSQGRRPLRELIREVLGEHAAAIEQRRTNAESIEEARLADEVLALLQG